MRESVLFVSRCERGERRMDVVELLAYCQAVNKPFGEFADELENIVAQEAKKKRGTKKRL